MALDKYGTGDDPYCYPGSNVLQNLLNIEGDQELAEAETELTELAVEEIEFDAPPYDLDYLQSLHRQVEMFMNGQANCAALICQKAPRAFAPVSALPRKPTNCFDS